MKASTKVVFGMIIVFLLLVVLLMIYPVAVKGTIKDYTYDYIEAQGYPTESIQDIVIKHSYLNRLLGYNEWRISVEFEERPNMFFWFSYRQKKIIYEGVSANPMLDKEDVIKYSDMFKNGTILDEKVAEENMSEENAVEESVPEENDPEAVETKEGESENDEEPSEDLEMSSYKFEIISNEENASVKAVLSYFDEEDHLVWEYKTDEIYVTELDVIQNIGFLYNGYCFIAGGKIYCIELQGENAGTLKWVNEDFQGASACWAIEDRYGLYNVIYLSGYYGPDFMAVDSKTGETMLRQDKLEFADDDAEDYYWPEEMSLDGDFIKIVFLSNEKSVYVNPQTGEVMKVE